MDVEMSAVAREVCSELTPVLRGYAQEFGLARDLANSLTLVWDGDTFLVHSPLSLDAAEYGDGKRPAPRPVHKAMNRMEPDVEALLERLISERLVGVAEGVRI